MFKVLISDKLHESGASLLENTSELKVVQATKLSEEELCKEIADAHALIVRSSTQVTETVLDAAKMLQVVGRAGIGVDNIDVKAASRRGVLVMNAPSGNSITTAEHAVSMLMSLARNIPQATS
ncbi:MAG TPA: phosphoglycerate dehydrogenase, partial [Myxococcales bacterium]|nr:phosphoglycerate dehydrogenase [Myxococcales bacterium]